MRLMDAHARKYLLAKKKQQIRQYREADDAAKREKAGMPS